MNNTHKLKRLDRRILLKYRSLHDINSNCLRILREHGVCSDYYVAVARLREAQRVVRELQQKANAIRIAMSEESRHSVNMSGDPTNHPLIERAL